MLLRIYFGLWGLVAVVAAALFASGNLTNLAVVIIGFMCMPLIFAGMIIVLPLTLIHSRSSDDHFDKQPSRHRVRQSINKVTKGWTVDDMSVRQLEEHHPTTF